jgi:zinc transport system substrate-binding protein
MILKIRNISSLMMPINISKNILVCHPSAVLSIEEDSYIGMRSLMKLKKVVEEENIKCVFSHSQKNSIKPKVLSNDVKMVILDPIGSDVEPGKDAYLAIIKSNAQNFKSCFAR